MNRERVESAIRQAIDFKDDEAVELFLRVLEDQAYQRGLEAGVQATLAELAATKKPTILQRIRRWFTKKENSK